MATLTDTPDTLTDWDLVHRAAAGDLDAFGDLYTRHYDNIRKIIRRRVTYPQLAEDLTQETFLRAFTHLNTVTNQGTAFGAWLTRIAVNLVRDHWKSNRYRYEESVYEESMWLRPSGTMISNTATPVHHRPPRDPCDMAVASDTARILHDTLTKLPPTQQRCLTLRYLDELSVAETMEVMGYSTVSAVKTLTHRGLKNTAALLPGGLR